MDVVETNQCGNTSGLKMKPGKNVIIHVQKIKILAEILKAQIINMAC